MPTAQPIAAAPVTIHLQAIGQHPAKLVSEVKAGDVRVWNFGLRGLVTAVRPASKMFVEVDTTTVCRVTGKSSTWTQRMKLAKLVGFSSQPWTEQG